MVIGSKALTQMGVSHVGPASADVTITDYVLVPVRSERALPLGGRAEYKMVHFTKKHPFILVPGGFVLAATKENFEFSKDVCGFVQGRSSIGRIGLTVQNAGFIDPGFVGTITLELVNEGRSPIALIPDYKVAQIVFLDVRDNELVYNGKYNGQVLPTGSRMHLDRKR